MSTVTKVGHKRVGAFLEQRARKLGGMAPIFYGDLAAHFGLPPVTEAWSGHPLCGIFEQLDVQDAKRGRPFRTAHKQGAQHAGSGLLQGVCEALSAQATNQGLTTAG